MLIIHQRLASYQVLDTVKDVKQLPVSVIICARNERENLDKNLHAFLNQDYPVFEIVVVNDCSADGSDILLRELSEKNPHLKVVNIAGHERFKHGKKFAVTLGIKAATNELLFFADADCKPVSDKWLSRMQQHFTGSTQIVLGYSPYEKFPGLLNRLIRFETFFTALNYLSFALAGRPYMGVGRNLAYTKALFFKGKGFASHMHILSGDDDLFVNQNATVANTVIEIHPDAQMISEPKRTLSTYFRQKLRHQGAGKMYKSAHKLLLMVQGFSAILFYVTLFALLVMSLWPGIVLALFLIRFLVQIWIWRPALRKLNCADLVWWLPALDFIYYFYMLALSIVTLFKNKIEWK